MNLKELEVQRDILLKELAAYVPLWDEEQAGLLRLLAVKLMKRSGVEVDLQTLATAVELNGLIKSAITLGYALRIYDERNNIERGQCESCDFFTTASVVEAA